MTLYYLVSLLLQRAKFICWNRWLSYRTAPSCNMINIQRYSEGTSSVAFRVPTINFQTYFISFLIFNSLTSDRNLFILNYLTSNFYLLKIYLSQAEDIDLLWTRVHKSSLIFFFILSIIFGTWKYLIGYLFFISIFALSILHSSMLPT